MVTDVGNASVHEQVVRFLGHLLLAQLLPNPLLNERLDLSVSERLEGQEPRWMGGYLLFWRSGKVDLWCF